MLTDMWCQLIKDNKTLFLNHNCTYVKWAWTLLFELDIIKGKARFCYLLDIAVSSLPDIGVEFYEQCLKFHTSTDMTAEEIHQTGLKEVERINKEMRNVLSELGHANLTVKQFRDFIRWPGITHNITDMSLCHYFQKRPQKFL